MMKLIFQEFVYRGKEGKPKFYKKKSIDKSSQKSKKRSAKEMYLKGYSKGKDFTNYSYDQKKQVVDGFRDAVYEKSYIKEILNMQELRKQDKDRDR